MKTRITIGKNRTGAGMSPIDARRTEAGADRSVPTSDGGERPLARWRADEARFDDGANALGTLPPPASVKGVVKSVANLVKGDQPLVLLDKLGERLAFERTGARLYQALIDKWPSLEPEAMQLGPTLVELLRLQDQELRHLGIVRAAIESLGADPTAMTPSADAVGVEGMGLVQLINDPRASLLDCLHVLLTAELVDNDGWVVLTDLADRLGHDAMAESFRQALLEEEEHLLRVRAWFAATTFAAAGVEEPAIDAPPPATPPSV